MKRIALPTVVLAAALALPAVPAARGDDNHIVAKVNGGRVAAFEEGEEAFGLETLFEVHARVRENGRARGDFYCELPGVIAIVGDVRQGSVNDDGSVTLHGIACWLNPDGSVLSEDEFFIVTFWPGGPGRGRFLYIDSFTGPAGDAETVTEGRIRIRLDD